MINKHLLDFTLASLLLEKKKNFFLVFVLSFLVFLVGSVFFIASALESNITKVSSELPDIIVQKRIGGRLKNIDIKEIYPLLDIAGVQTVIPRVWGSYYFLKGDVYFHIVGIDRFDYDYASFLQTKIDLKNGMIVGEGIKNILEKNFYNNEFSFFTPHKEILKLPIIATFPKESNLYSYDIMLMDLNNAQKILDIPKDKVTDLALYVPNKEEIPTIVSKITLLDPNYYIKTQSDIQNSYKNLYNYKGGIFLIVFIIALFTFFMIVSDRLSGMSSIEQKEIAILKAIGWSIEDIIKQKFLQSGIIAFFSFLFGIALALVYVFFFQAPLLREIFEHSSVLNPPFIFGFDIDYTVFGLIFFITIPIYIASVIIPAWRVAAMDVDEVLR